MGAGQRQPQPDPGGCRRHCGGGSWDGDRVGGTCNGFFRNSGSRVLAGLVLCCDFGYASSFILAHFLSLPLCPSPITLRDIMWPLSTFLLNQPRLVLFELPLENMSEIICLMLYYMLTLSYIPSLTARWLLK